MTELQYYQQALKDYKKAYWKSLFSTKGRNIKMEFEVHTGFCGYFFHRHGLYIFDIELFQMYLPILYSRRPFDITEENPYWFKSGALRPRIKLLKEAIKLCKL